MGRNKSAFVNVLLLISTILICLSIFEVILRHLEMSCSIMNEKGETPFVISDDVYYMKPEYGGGEKCIGFDVKVRTNSEGYRDSEFNPKIRAIFLFGDSLVFGTGVEQQETFSEVLEKVFLKDIAVYNFGTVGYSLKDYIKQYEKYSDKYNPELIIVSLYEGNDVQEDCGLINRADFFGNRRKGFGRIKDFAKKLYVVRFIEPLLKNLINLGESSITSKQFYLVDEPETVKKCNDILKNNMRQLMEKTYADNRSIMFVILPSKANFMKSDNPSVDYDKKIKGILKYCSELNLTCLNIKDYMGRPEEVYLKEGHLNVKGHYKIAEVISRLITEKELLKY